MKWNNAAIALVILSAAADHAAAFVPTSGLTKTTLQPLHPSRLVSPASRAPKSTRNVVLAMAKQKKKKGGAEQKRKKKMKAVNTLERAGDAPYEVKFTTAPKDAAVGKQPDVATAEAIPDNNIVLAETKPILVVPKEEIIEVPLAVKQKDEATRRSLLNTRLIDEQQERLRKQLAVKQQREVTKRNLLKTRLLNERQERLRKEEQAKQDAIKLAQKQTRELLSRGLLETRLANEKLERELKETDRKRQTEKKQRALLTERLGQDARIKEAIRLREESFAKRKAAIAEARRQPKTPEEEQKLKEKYAAIENLSQRAFAIKLDLGIIEITPDPSDPDYDPTYDDEIAPGIVFLN